MGNKFQICLSKCWCHCIITACLSVCSDPKSVQTFSLGDPPPPWPKTLPPPYPHGDPFLPGPSTDLFKQFYYLGHTSISKRAVGLLLKGLLVNFTADLKNWLEEKWCVLNFILAWTFVILCYQWPIILEERVMIALFWISDDAASWIDFACCYNNEENNIWQTDLRTYNRMF